MPHDDNLKIETEIALLKKEQTAIKEQVDDTNKKVGQINNQLNKIVSKLFKDEDTGEIGIFKRVDNLEEGQEFTKITISKAKMQFAKAVGFFFGVGMVVGYFVSIYLKTKGKS